MLLKLVSNSYRYEMENVCRLFFPEEKIVCIKDGEDLDATKFDIFAVAEIETKENNVVFSSKLIFEKGEFYEEEILDIGDEHLKSDKEKERILGITLYNTISQALDLNLEWGAITGVRPMKLVRTTRDRLGTEGAKKWLSEKLLISDKKIDLCFETIKTEDEILRLSKPNSFSLYISIPFCPTRCDYCSFVSHTVEKAGHLIPDYVKNLCKEIEITGNSARELGLKLETVYVGGGTPTSISALDLEKITNAVSRNFDLTNVLEYTVEAGRPDTIDVDKLRVLKSAGISRISINPQTLNEDILKNIGRNHSVKEFYNAYEIAGKVGFKTINVDLIAALPEDTLESFKNSVDGIIRLGSENITIHTLALKRASNLAAENRNNFMAFESAVKMIDYSHEALNGNSYIPYYLYRQSRVVGNMENLGWSKPGHEGLYNVFIMDETHSIFACGAGAVTKLKRPENEKNKYKDELKIKRVFNYKFPYEYNRDFDKLMERKKQINEFYQDIQF